MQHVLGRTAPNRKKFKKDLIKYIQIKHKKKTASEVRRGFRSSTWSKEVKLGAKTTFKTTRSKSGHWLSEKRQKNTYAGVAWTLP